jgi:hypothetical protein
MKTKRYWLRVAIVAVMIHVVLSSVLISIVGLHPINNNDLVGLVFPNVFLGILFVDFLPDIFGEWSVLWWLVLYWFIVGAFIGWIYGKMKKV